MSENTKYLIIGLLLLAVSILITLYVMVKAMRPDVLDSGPMP